MTRPNILYVTWSKYRQQMGKDETVSAVKWALEKAPNPRVIRVHTTIELTQATIEKCPPTIPPEGLRSVLTLHAVDSIDLHRYRARLNLNPDWDARTAFEEVNVAIGEAWGAPSGFAGEPLPRAFEVPYQGARIVAESLEMAGLDGILSAFFRVEGVAEAVLEPGKVSVRLGRLFSWKDVEASVRLASRTINQIRSGRPF